MKLVKTLVAVAAVAGSAGAFAQSANLDIAGTITDSPCTLVITGGNVDHGALTVAGVNSFGSAAGFRSIPAVARTVDVACPSPSTVALAVSDPYAASKLGEGNAYDDVRFGLVNSAQSNAPLGFTYLQVGSSVLVDGVSAGTMLFTPGTTGTPAWVEASTVPNGASYLKGDSSVGWTVASGAVAPVAISSLSVPLNVNTRVNINAMNAQKAGGITMLGRATFVLRSL